MELNRLYNADCLKGMQDVPDGSVDLIVCDPPYGTMKGIDDKHDWDEIIPTDKLFEQYERVLRKGGVAILFSQEPYTSHLRTFKAKNMDFCYPLIWLKDSAGNIMGAKSAPLSYFEDINVFAKKYDTQNIHPLRDYFSRVLRYCGAKSCKQINERLGHRHAEHTFYVDSTQFTLCTEETYDELIEVFGIDKMEGFMMFDELQKINRKYERTFNLPEGKASKSNVLQYAKDTDGFHPTQKPVALIADLIRTYSNEGDTILDNCMGSGTTAVAAIRTGRNWIGYEMNENFYKQAQKRIEHALISPTLF